jgi:hypothetical protein
MLRDRLIEDLQALVPDLVACVDGDTGDVAARRARLIASPACTGSPPIQTIGIVLVAACAAFAIASLLATITSGLQLTTSRTRFAYPSGRPSPEYRSIERFCSSISPAQRSSSNNACRARDPVLLMLVMGPAGMTIAIRRCFAGSCARSDCAEAASNRPAVTSRRLISRLRLIDGFTSSPDLT